MGTRDERPTIQETVGRAVGASALVMSEDREETPLVRVAAIGGAAATMAANRDRLSSTGTVSKPRAASNQDRLCAKLAPLLWRLKFGGDATRETALDAVSLLRDWMSLQPFCLNHGMIEDRKLLARFTARVLFEWIADKCSACGGTGLQELLRGGITRRTRSFANPKVRHVTCRACGGTRKAVINGAERSRAMEISLSEYRARWPHRFVLGTGWVNRISRRLTNPLRCELERCINSSCRETGVCQRQK